MEECTRAEEDASHIDRHLPIPFLRRRVFDPLSHLNRGVINQDIQRTKFTSHEGPETVDGLGIGDIRLKSERVASLRANGGSCRLRFGSIYVHEYYSRTFPAQGAGYRAADPRAGPGDDRYPSL
jgi:hypothetical protein